MPFEEDLCHNSSIVINSELNANLDDLFITYPKVHIFYLRPGNYHVTRQLNIFGKHISLIGHTEGTENVVIRQTTPQIHTLNIEGEHIYICNLTIYCAPNVSDPENEGSFLKNESIALTGGVLDWW